MDLGTTSLSKHWDTEIIQRSARCSKEEELENRQCWRVTFSIHTLYSCATLGPRERKRTKSKFQAASRRLYPPGPAGQNGFAQGPKDPFTHVMFNNHNNPERTAVYLAAQLHTVMVHQSGSLWSCLSTTLYHQTHYKQPPHPSPFRRDYTATAFPAQYINFI